MRKVAAGGPAKMGVIDQNLKENRENQCVYCEGKLERGEENPHSPLSLLQCPHLPLFSSDNESSKTVNKKTETPTMLTAASLS